MLAVRYLALDGKVARRFYRAVRAFAQPDVELPLSKYDDPVGYDTWVAEPMGAYYDGDVSAADTTLVVPFSSPASLRVVMHAISASAEGLIQVTPWRYPAEEEVSDEEKEVVRPKVRAQVQPEPYRCVVAPPEASEGSTAFRELWSYDAPLEGQYVRERRHAMSWAKTDRGLAAVELLRQRFLAIDDDGGSSAMRPRPVPEELESKVVVDLGPAVVAHTPGGTGVVEIDSPVYGRLARGEKMTAKSAVSLLETLDAEKAVSAFSRTTVFDGWSPPWVSMWLTLGDSRVLNECLAAGVHGVAMRLVQELYDRFRQEALHYFSTSNLYRDKVRKLFGKTVSINRLARQVRAGKVGIAQSDRFVDRWLQMLDLHGKVLEAMEKTGVFDPLAVTKTQETMPIDRGKKRRVVPLPAQFRVV
jgi:hypothetical protein